MSRTVAISLPDGLADWCASKIGDEAQCLSEVVRYCIIAARRAETYGYQAPAFTRQAPEFPGPSIRPGALPPDATQLP